MKKFLGLFLASAMLASVASAYEAEGDYSIGADEFTAPILVEAVGPILGPNKEARRYRCPEGFEKVAAYQWNDLLHRWEFAGYNCRKDRRGLGN